MKPFARIVHTVLRNNNNNIFVRRQLASCHVIGISLMAACLIAMPKQRYEKVVNLASVLGIGASVAHWVKQNQAVKDTLSSTIKKTKSNEVDIYLLKIDATTNKVLQAINYHENYSLAVQLAAKYNDMSQEYIYDIEYVSNIDSLDYAFSTKPAERKTHL